MLREFFGRFRKIGRAPPSVNFEPVPHEPPLDVNKMFWRMVADHRPRKVLEAGTLQSVSGRSTHHRAGFPQLAENDYVKLDLRPGPDVDVVGDLHALPNDWTGQFECFIAIAVWEHLERPWIAAKEVARILAPGGFFLISTHQCFPIHGYPRDFFRFSREALKLIIEDAGLSISACEYRHRCMIVPPNDVVPQADVGDWNSTWPSYVLVEAIGRKLA
jgi:SAM-dependent methyltransferase